jgi:hypothetical protein
MKTGREKRALSLCGSGFMGMYHLGVADSVQRYAPHRYTDIIGASAGALVGAILASNVPAESFVGATLQVAKDTRAQRFGCVTPGFQLTELLRTIMEKHLPLTAHETCQSNGLHICVSGPAPRLWRQTIVSHWQSREGLIQCLQRSSYIPLFTGPAIASWQYLDGGIFTGNWPSLSGTKTEFSSPFAGPRFEIAPRGDTTERQQSARIHGVYVDVSAHNLQAAWGALVPWDEDRLQRLYERGQADARSFLSSLDSTGS